MPFIPSSALLQSEQVGNSVLLYDYTVSGSDKATIDTGVDEPDAGISGTNPFEALRLLEIHLYARTDNAVTFDSATITFNNDASAIYDRINMRDTNTTLAQDNSLAQTAFVYNVAGASLASGVFGTFQLTIPNYAGADGNKFGFFHNSVVDTAAANTRIQTGALGYRSASALTRLAVTPFSGGQKYKVGTRLTIFAR